RRADSEGDPDPRRHGMLIGHEDGGDTDIAAARPGSGFTRLREPRIRTRAPLLPAPCRASPSREAARCGRARLEPWRDAGRRACRAASASVRWLDSAPAGAAARDRWPGAIR